MERWNTDNLPIDIWALDMNWRNSPYGCGTCKPCDPSKCPYETNDNHYYDHPNVDLFPDFANNGTGWFDFLKGQGLRTYFNDHPFPADHGAALQTQADEINFRWDGLTHWMDKGLSFWWFDANWGFSIPPPTTKYSGAGDGTSWDGMDNRVWGSHVYYETMRAYNERHPSRAHSASTDRPMSLTKYAADNMVPGLVQHQHPAHHRFPVWWTGDGVTLQASVQSMVDSGVYDLKPYVHSDCGGDYRGKVGGDLLRWASHCALGTILRFHGEQHQPWSYDAHTENVLRQYLNLRYKLIPSLVTAGHVATMTGFPIVVRCDFFWPEHSEAQSNEQYLHLNDTLIAPIWDSTKNMTSRSVWIPPGTWEDGWDGNRVIGPQTITVTKPYEQIPMWHKINSAVLTTSTPGLRVDDQVWNELVLDVYLSGGEKKEKTVEKKEEVMDLLLWSRAVMNRNDGTLNQTIRVVRKASGSLSIFIDEENHGTQEAPLVTPRTWIIRLHLAKNQTAVTTVTGQKKGSGGDDGRNITKEVTSSIRKKIMLHHHVLKPMDNDDENNIMTDTNMFFPMAGKGSRPPVNAGDIVEIVVDVGIKLIEVLW